MRPERDASLPIVIVGGGAAGLMAGIHAAGGPRPVLLLEGAHRPGQKILLSGGGRCNLLPSQAAAADYITAGSPYTLRNIFNSWPLAEARRFFEEELRLPLALEPGTGKLFPAAGQSQAVLDAIVGAYQARGGMLRLGAPVVGLARDTAWQVLLESGQTVPAAAVVLATGGLSAPGTGSDGSGFRLARALGHSLVPTYPALVPLANQQSPHRALAGISLPVTLTTPLPGGQRLLASRGGFLFTHRGYSGPAVLNLSHLAVQALMMGSPLPPIWVQWTGLGQGAWDDLLRTRSGRLLPLLRDTMPERLAVRLLAETKLAGATGAQLRKEDRARLVEALARYPLPYTGHEGFKTAEVTGGGIPLGEVDPATLESRLAPGLFFCGEMLDAFGPIGGYNLLWAWITGRLAGSSAAR